MSIAGKISTPMNSKLRAHAIVLNVKLALIRSQPKTINGARTERNTEKAKSTRTAKKKRARNVRNTKASFHNPDGACYSNLIFRVIIFPSQHLELFQS